MHMHDVHVHVQVQRDSEIARFKARKISRIVHKPIILVSNHY